MYIVTNIGVCIDLSRSFFKELDQGLKEPSVWGLAMAVVLKWPLSFMYLIDKNVYILTSLCSYTP